MQENMKEYLTEKEAREKRLEVYTEKIQEKVLSRSSETIRQLVEERHRQKIEYSCAVTPQVRQTGNRLSGLAGTAYASLLA